MRTDVDHVEEEGQLAADAVLPVAGVVQHLQKQAFRETFFNPLSHTLHLLLCLASTDGLLG